ncbi:MAG: glycosyltransferase [Candidatus Saccharibacteria bacterium]|jgi:glycosyltransferase involved in cell wall biosynthesis|nr:glycosyltransferase [Candidatus Saccharibacteria bacterium]
MLMSKPYSKRLRVLFVLPPFLPTPPQGYGGIEAVAAALIPALQRAGARLTVTTPYGSKLKVSELRTITEPLYKLQSGSYFKLAYGIDLYAAKVLQIARQGRFDVIHDNSGLLAVTNVLAAASTEKDFPPVIHTMHNPIPVLADNYLELAKLPGFNFVAVSKAQLHTAPIVIRQKGRVVYNCVDPQDFQVGPGGDRLLVMGRFIAEKGQDQLIRYCAANGIPLDVAGPIADSDLSSREQILAEAAKGADSDYYNNPAFRLFVKTLPYIDGELIRFHGSVAGEAKEHLLQNARAMVIPNRWAEPFGMVALEAMASGTPVLACGGGAMPELVKHGTTGYVADTFEDLTQYFDPAWTDQIYRTLCRKHVETNFSASAAAANTIKLYHELISPVPTPASVVKSLGLRSLPKPSSEAPLDFYEQLPDRRTKQES